MFVDNSNETNVVGKNINIISWGYCDSDFELQSNEIREIRRTLDEQKSICNLPCEEGRTLRIEVRNPLPPHQRPSYCRARFHDTQLFWEASGR